MIRLKNINPHIKKKYLQFSNNKYCKNNNCNNIN